MLPSQDRRHIIDVSVRFAELATSLKQLAEDESDIVHVTLRDPTGAVLGDVPGRAEGETEIRSTVPADNGDCCECKASGRDMGQSRYSYEFVARLSNESLRASIKHLRERFALIFALMVAASLAVTAWISRLLTRRVQSIRAEIDAIVSSRDFSRQLQAAGDRTDELDALAGHFNHLVGSMREAQAEIIEAKKSEVRAAVAAQVAHDIRSPLTSMTLALTQLQGVLRGGPIQAETAEMISVLSHGISRVSGILKRLSGKKKEGEGAAPVENPRLTLVDKVLLDVALEHSLRLPANQKLVCTGFGAVPNVWAVVQVTELQAALSNLMNNAFEAMP